MRRSVYFQKKLNKETIYIFEELNTDYHSSFRSDPEVQTIFNFNSNILHGKLRHKTVKTVSDI